MVPPTEAAPRPPQGPAEAPAAGRRARRAVPRWVGLVTNLGLALAAVVGIQLLAALLEGLSMGIGQLASLPTADRLHRLGYAFSANFGMPAPLTLVVAVVLVSLPVLVGQRTRESQEQNAILTLWLVVVEAVLIGLGSLLAVRYNLARLAAQGAVFPFARVELSIFLAGVLGVSTVAAVAALVGRQIREPHR